MFCIFRSRRLRPSGILPQSGLAALPASALLQRPSLDTLPWHVPC
jgi:hypothetical protein